MTEHTGTYDAFRARWTFLHDAYLGGSAFKSPSESALASAQVRWNEVDENGRSTTHTRTYPSYLVPFPAESDRSFELRIALSSVVNPCELIVDAYAEGVTGNVKRDMGSLEPFADDVDQRGSAWGEFVEESARWACAYGGVATVVDSPAESDAVTRADELAEGVQPYCVNVHAPAWAWVKVNARGKPVEFAYVEEAYNDRASVGMSTVTVRVYDLDGWRVLKGSVRTSATMSEQADKLAAIDEGEAPAPIKGKRLPIEFLFYKRLTESRYPRGVSLIDGAADIARTIFNKRSWSEQIAREAGFPTLAVPMPDTGGQMPPETRMSIGTSKAFGYGASSGAPAWIQPSPEWVRELREECAVDYQHALRSAGLEMAADASAQIQSGEALRIRSRDFEARAKRFGNQCERWERSVLSLYAALAGEPEDFSVQYPARYVLPDLSADLQRAMTLLKDSPVEIGATAKQKAAVQMVDAALALSEEERRTVSEEIGKVLGEDAEEYEAERRTRGAARSIEETEATRKLQEMMAAEEEEPAAPAPAEAPAQKTESDVQVNAFDYDAGIVTVNEARAMKLGLPPIEGGHVSVLEWRTRIAAENAPKNADGASTKADGTA